MIVLFELDPSKGYHQIDPGTEILTMAWMQ